MEFDDNIQSDTPLGILRGIKHGTESYHDLFKRLCRLVIGINYQRQLKLIISNKLKIAHWENFAFENS